MSDLQHAVDVAGAAALLPPLRAAEAARVEEPLTVLLDHRLDETGRLRFLVIRDARGERYGVPAVVEDGAVRRAAPGDGAAAALIATLVPGHPAVSESGVPVDQTNELVIVGDLIVKWYLHPTPGNDVALHRLDALAAQGFTGTPALRGRLVAPDGSLLALVTDWLPGALDGWDWAVDDLRAHALMQEDDGLARVRDLAGLVARLHVALAAAGTRMSTTAEVTRWAEQAEADAASAGLDPAVGTPVRRILSAIGDAGSVTVMPVHGDLHIGQVLRTRDGDLVIIDFDGNPLLGADAGEWAPAARDVAGMMASLDHVGRVVLHRTPDLDDEQRSVVARWIRRAPHEFLGAYREHLRAGGCEELLDERLLLPFRVQQECREYAYATRYLPHWRYVPDAALPALLAESDPSRAMGESRTIGEGGAHGS